MALSLAQDSDEIVRSLGDMLLHLGCDTGCLVPNTVLNASALNARIAQYQRHLDALELEVSTAVSAARQRVPKQEEPVSAPKQENSAGSNGDELVSDAAGAGAGNNGRDNGIGSSANEQRPAAEDDEDMYFYKNSEPNLFEDLKNDDYGIMDDFF